MSSPSSPTTYFGEPMPSYPMQVHPAASASRGSLVAQQPAPAKSMSVHSPEKDEEESKLPAARLRGGCIPCPDGGCCWIIPIPCCC